MPRPAKHRPVTTSLIDAERTHVLTSFYIDPDVLARLKVAAARADLTLGQLLRRGALRELRQNPVSNAEIVTAQAKRDRQRDRRYGPIRRVVKLLGKISGTRDRRRVLLECGHQRTIGPGRNHPRCAKCLRATTKKGGR